MAKAVIRVRQHELPTDVGAIVVHSPKGATHHKEVIITGPCKITELDKPDMYSSRVIIECDTKDIKVKDYGKGKTV